MSYLEHFGLSSEPFSNAPVSRFYYSAPQHQQALQRLLYAVNSMKGLAVLVGEIGAGKTTLARRLLDSMPEEEYEAALLVIIHSGINAGWLLRRIALQLGVENPAQEKLALLSQLYQRLLQIYEQGRKAVVLIDEAQMLETRELMEEFRGLLNLEVPERKLISFVFFGLPEIEKNLKLDAPLAQRVAMRYRLEPFTSDSTDAYIKHRLRLAGSTHGLFTAAAVEAVHRRAGGTPRVINTLCDNALFETFLARAREIDAPLIEQIADNLGLEYGAPAPVAVELPPAPPAEPPPIVAVARGASGPAVARPPAGAAVVGAPLGLAAAPPVTANMPAAQAGSASLSALTTQPGPGFAGALAAAPVVPLGASNGASRSPSSTVPATAPAIAPVSLPSASPAVGGAPGLSVALPSAQGAPAPAPGGASAAPPVRPVVAGVPVNVLIRPGSPRPSAPAEPVAGNAGTSVDPGGTNAVAGAPSKARTGVDLAEIDRYLEGLGKL